jgi:hypothetical protein
MDKVTVRAASSSLPQLAKVGATGSTLELHYSDGRSKRTSFLIEPGKSKTDVRQFPS